MGKLEDRVAIVTGGARGIGGGTAVELAREGADVAILDIRPEADAAAVREEIAGLGRRCYYAQGDVTDQASDARFVEETVKRLGRVDILVNNTGRGARAPFLEADVAHAHSVFDVTFWAGFYMTQLAARQMVKQGEGGSVVFISSVHSYRPYANASSYNAAKAAVNHLAATLALELAPHRIRVNWIEPGWIDTPGEHEHFGKEMIEREGPKLLWGRLGQPAEIGRGVVFLASSEASYVTGTGLRIDGGFVLPNPR